MQYLNLSEKLPKNNLKAYKQDIAINLYDYRSHKTLFCFSRDNNSFYYNFNINNLHYCKNQMLLNTIPGSFSSINFLALLDNAPVQMNIAGILSSVAFE